MILIGDIYIIIIIIIILYYYLYYYIGDIDLYEKIIITNFANF